MIIGCVREVKDDEYRVGINPESAKAYLAAGHTVLIETNAGVGSGFTDEKYQEIGCHIIETAQEVWEKAEMMIKVKEPAKSEYELLKENSILYTYLHLAADKELTQKMAEKKVIGVAYETVQYPGEDLPLLKPMSMIAGRLATQQGAKYLEKTYGGKGMLLSGLIGSQPSDVVIVGSGNVATGAILLAYGMGANVHVVSTDPKQLEAISASYPDRLTIHKSTRENIEKLRLREGHTNYRKITGPRRRTVRIFRAMWRLPAAAFIIRGPIKMEAKNGRKRYAPPRQNRCARASGKGDAGALALP